MRKTTLARPDGATMEMTTDDYGTDVLDDKGKMVASHRTDQHDQLLERFGCEGWSVTDDANVAPAAVAGSKPIETGPAVLDPTATVNPGTG